MGHFSLNEHPVPRFNELQHPSTPNMSYQLLLTIYFTNYVTPSMSHQLHHTNYVIPTTSHQLCQTNYVIPTMSNQLCQTNYVTNHVKPTVSHHPCLTATSIPASSSATALTNFILTPPTMSLHLYPNFHHISESSIIHDQKIG